MSIDNVDPVEEEDVLEVEAARLAKRRRLNEIRRYDADSGGAVGVGMGVAKDDDRVVIDDLDPK
jgi:enhancer of polycomb-like protein